MSNKRWVKIWTVRNEKGEWVEVEMAEIKTDAIKRKQVLDEG